MSSEAEPKQRILQAAIELFAQKGFAATGVREIASRAGVNLSMISYYFGSKQKMLEAIFGYAIESFGEVFRASFQKYPDRPLQDILCLYFESAVALGRRHQALLRILLSTLHYDTPELAAYRASKIRQDIFPILLPYLQRHSHELRCELPPLLLGPTLNGMVLFHFFLSPIIAQVTGLELDDGFYASYARQLADFALYGLLGQRPE